MSNYIWSTAAPPAAFQPDPSSRFHQQVQHVHGLEETPHTSSNGVADCYNQAHSSIPSNMHHAHVQHSSHSLPYPPSATSDRLGSNPNHQDTASNTTSSARIRPEVDTHYRSYNQMRTSIKHWHELAYPDGRGVSCPQETFSPATDNRARIYIVCSNKGNRKYECAMKINVVPEGRKGYVVTAAQLKHSQQCDRFAVLRAELGDVKAAEEKLESYFPGLKAYRAKYRSSRVKKKVKHSSRAADASDKVLPSSSSLRATTTAPSASKHQNFPSAFSVGSTHSFSTFEIFKEQVKSAHDADFNHGASLHIRQGPEKTDEGGQHRSFPFAICAVREKGKSCSFRLKFEQIKSVYIVREANLEHSSACINYYSQQDADDSDEDSYGGEESTSETDDEDDEDDEDEEDEESAQDNDDDSFQGSDYSYELPSMRNDGEGSQPPHKKRRVDPSNAFAGNSTHSSQARNADSHLKAATSRREPAQEHGTAVRGVNTLPLARPRVSATPALSESSRSHATSSTSLVPACIPRNRPTAHTSTSSNSIQPQQTAQNESFRIRSTELPSSSKMTSDGILSMTSGNGNARRHNPTFSVTTLPVTSAPALRTSAATASNSAVSVADASASISTTVQRGAIPGISLQSTLEELRFTKTVCERFREQEIGTLLDIRDLNLGKDDLDMLCDVVCSTAIEKILTKERLLLLLASFAN